MQARGRGRGRTRGSGRGRGGATGGRGIGGRGLSGASGGTLNTANGINMGHIPELDQLELDEARDRNNPNTARNTRHGTDFGNNAGTADAARDEARRIFQAALTDPNDPNQDSTQDPVNDFLQVATDQQGVSHTTRPKYTIVQHLEGCGLDVGKATAVAQDLFVHKYIACKNISETTLYHRFKRLARSTDNPICLSGGDENFIQAFIFWVKEKIILGEDPASTLFPPELVGTINDRCTNHKKYLAQCTREAPGYKPDKFTKDMKWRDWADEYIGYLKYCPGTDGVPLSYIIRNTGTTLPTTGGGFLQHWVDKAPLQGYAYNVDALSIHTSLTKSISGHDRAEAAIQAVKYLNDGRAVWRALVEHFEGQGIYAYDFAKAEGDFYTLEYTGEKPPTMDWKEFESRLRSMFLVYDKKYRANYHHQQHKLSILLRKIRCDWMINTTLEYVRGAASSNPPTTDFEGAMTSFRAAVQARYPPNGLPAPVRRIKAVESSKGPWQPKAGLHTDDQLITLDGGGSCHFHVSYWFPPNIFKKLPEERKKAARDHRNKRRGNVTTKRTIQELQTEISQLRAATTANATSPPCQANCPESASLDDQLSSITKSYISQVSQATKTSIMGGRNEQAFKRSKSN